MGSCAYKLRLYSYWMVEECIKFLLTSCKELLRSEWAQRVEWKIEFLYVPTLVLSTEADFRKGRVKKKYKPWVGYRLQRVNKNRCSKQLCSNACWFALLLIISSTETSSCFHRKDILFCQGELTGKLNSFSHTWKSSSDVGGWANDIFTSDEIV